jgi:hypothetical protein
VHASKCLKAPADAAAFLEAVGAKLAEWKLPRSEEPALLLSMTVAEKKLEAGDVAAAKAAIEDGAAALERLPEPDPSVSAAVHYVSSLYYKLKKDYAKFYRSSMQVRRGRPGAGGGRGRLAQRRGCCAVASAVRRRRRPRHPHLAPPPVPRVCVERQPAARLQGPPRGGHRARRAAGRRRVRLRAAADAPDRQGAAGRVRVAGGDAGDLQQVGAAARGRGLLLWAPCVAACMAHTLAQP